jgi:hypothetical protein
MLKGALVKRIRFEVWKDYADESLLLTTSKNISNLKSRGQLSKTSTFQYAIVAATPEEASSIHNLRQGWEPYKPMGPASKCPHACGLFYYPEGSGVCPNCGKV